MKNATLNRISRLLPLVIPVGLALTGSTLSAGNTSSNNRPEGATVHALFDLDTPKGGPFPSDRFTVEDRTHLTGLRVSLPYPDCTVRVSDCEDLDVINTLDGFNLQPRLSVPFDGAIDVETVTSGTVFLIKLGCPGDDDDHGEECNHDEDDGRRPVTVGINQIVWDTFTKTLHVESDELLDQHTRYALIVTRGVREESGRPIEATQAFQRFRQTVRGAYKQALLEAIRAARRVGIRESDIAVASVFTTQSVTAILEKIRDQIKATPPHPADFNLGPDGLETVFRLDQVTGITFNRHNRVGHPLDPVALNLSLLRMVPGAVGQVAFGKHPSPDYLTTDRFIPPVGTRTGTPEPQVTSDIYFNLFLPSGAKPAHGWPVAILGHSGSSSKQEFRMVGALAEHGVATIMVNAVGRGLGPLGTLQVNLTDGRSVTFSAGGRGIDQDGNGIIGDSEGASTTRPRGIIGDRDAQRQTSVDLMQLVRVIEVGMDVDGDGLSDLDPSRISYVGPSFGGGIGIQFLAVEPSVQVGAAIVPGGGGIFLRRGPAPRGGLGAELGSRIPSLLNAPGITRIDEVAVSSGPHFNENVPLRNGIRLAIELTDGTSSDIQSPVINAVPGAMEIQELFENTEWVAQSGDVTAYAPYIRKDPLPGMPAKSVILVVAKGDQTALNPRTTATIRAGDLADRVTFYRNDLAFAEDIRVPRNPHVFIVGIDSNIPLAREVAGGAQRQIAVFFASDGAEVMHPEPARFFELPILLPLPEGLNFIP